MRSQTNYQQDRLWYQSPCTQAFTTTGYQFDKSQRFKHFSIYHKDDINKPKKVFNDIEKPQLLLLKFRRQIQQASSDRFKQNNKKNNGNNKNQRATANKSNGITRTLSYQYQLSEGKRNPLQKSKAEMITDRLYQIKNKQQYLYDRYGNRCNLQKVQKKQNSKKELPYIQKVQDRNKSFDQTKTTFFTTARRFDLSRPLNFYPAANKYSHHVAFLPQRKKYVRKIYKIPSPPKSEQKKKK